MTKYNNNSSSEYFLLSHKDFKTIEWLKENDPGQYGDDAKLFAQKINWQRVRSIAAMPTSHRDGSLFVTKKDQMPWGA